MSLPESKEAKGLYINTRDMFNRFRRDALERGGGDVAALKAHVFDHLDLLAEFAQFRESIDFANQEGLLTPGQDEAAQASIDWGETLRARLKGSEEGVWA
jgi:hypothetical protein